MLTVTVCLVLGAFISTLISAAVGKCPLWIPVLLLCVVHLLAILPR